MLGTNNLIIAIALIAMLGGGSYLLSQNKKLQAENERQSGNVSTLMGTVEKYKVRDSLNVASLSALNLTVEELKKYRADDATLIKDLKLRPKDVEYIVKTEIVTRDSLLYKVDSVGCFHYLDKWLRVDACIGDSCIVIGSRDSIA